jgi:hypothetical protein
LYNRLFSNRKAKEVMKLLVEFDLPEGWGHYTEEQNLLRLTNWGATNDGVTAKIVTDEQIKKVPEMIEALNWFINSMNDGSLIVFTDDDQSKAVRDNNQDMINKIEVIS